MLKNEKPLAWFSCALPIEGFCDFEQKFGPYVEQGILLRFDRITFDLDFREVRDTCYTLPNQARRAEEALNLIELRNSGKIPTDIDFHVKMGRLLGYSEEAIQDFVKPISSAEIIQTVPMLTPP